MNKKTLYLDLDDTILDCTQYLLQWHGKESPFSDPAKCGSRNIHGYLGMDWDTCWNQLPSVFWETVPFCPWGQDVVKLAENYFGNEVYLLTSPIPNGECSKGKQLWVNKFMPEYKSKLIIGHEKHACVGHDGILIDDSYSMEERFAKYNKSSSFFLFPSYLNKLHGVMDQMYKDPSIAIKMVQATLDSLER
jgi:5'(3')-deoxyribonucleotidase